MPAVASDCARPCVALRGVTGEAGLDGRYDIADGSGLTGLLPSDRWPSKPALDWLIWALIGAGDMIPWSSEVRLE